MDTGMTYKNRNTHTYVLTWPCKTYMYTHIHSLSECPHASTHSLPVSYTQCIPLSYMYMHLHTETYIYAGLDPKFLGSFFCHFQAPAPVNLCGTDSQTYPCHVGFYVPPSIFLKEQPSQPGCNFLFCIKWGHSSEQHDSPKAQNCCPWLFGSLIQSCLRKGI